MQPSAVSRRQLFRGFILAVILLLLTPAAVSALTYNPNETTLQPGAIKDPANGSTVVAVQGFHFQGRGAEKKPARLAGYGPKGDVQWVHDGRNVGARWFYDVDPLDDGTVLVTATNPDGTLIYSYDPETDEQVWVEHLDIHDTHDVDLINEDELLVANMRNYNNDTGQNDDRLFIYNRTRGEIVWEWYFRDHYPRVGGGKWTGDWTHVNDVDKIDDGQYMASVRNFDQVIAVNRSTKEIDWRLGEDNADWILHEQHNPQYLESENGTPTVLVADSENARIIEYARRGDGWEETWTLGGPEVFAWPRDADRLPNGNTLIVDSMNHRVIEVTPTGEIVWEVYAPWGTYDAERVRWGDEAYAYDRPTITDMNASGSYTVSGSAGLVPGTGDRLTFPQRLQRTFAGTPVENEVQWFAIRWAHIAPWVYPVWMGSWDFVAIVAAVFIGIGWAGGEAILARHRLLAWLRRQMP